MGDDDATRITTDIDLDREGKQIGHLRVPWSRNTSAWGAVHVPIAVIQNGDGPTVLFTAGAHGDELEGPVTLSRVARELSPDAIRGRVVLVPTMNVPGMRASTRLCPIDGRDLNRTFPGAADGTYTQMVTHWISTRLVPRADVVVDLHSGGYSLDFSPCIIIHHLPDTKMRERSLAALRAFGGPLGMVLRELDDAGTLDTFVEGRGTTFLTTELRGGGRLSVEALRIAYHGFHNVLWHFGLLGEDHPAVTGSESPTERLVEVPHAGCYVTAPEDGAFEPFVDLGDEVPEGAPVGRLWFLQTPERDPIELRARHGGTIVCRRAPARTETGDTLLVIASGYSG